jgi:hypothetical protein
MTETEGKQEIPTLKQITTPKLTFLSNYSKSNICSRFTYHFASGMIDSVNKNGGSMTDAMVLDSTRAGESLEQITERFENETAKRL